MGSNSSSHADAEAEGADAPVSHSMLTGLEISWEMRIDSATPSQIGSNGFMPLNVGDGSIAAAVAAFVATTQQLTNSNIRIALRNVDPSNVYEMSNESVADFQAAIASQIRLKKGTIRYFAITVNLLQGVDAHRDCSEFAKRIAMVLKGLKLQIRDESSVTFYKKDELLDDQQAHMRETMEAAFRNVAISHHLYLYPPADD